MTMRWRMLALMTGSQVGGAIVQQGLGSLAPVLLITFALSKTQLGTIFAALSIGSALFTTLAGVIVDRYGERVVTLWGGVLLGATLLAASAVASYPWLVACIFLFGISYAAQTPAGGRAVLAWFDRDRGLAMSIRQTGVPLGGAIGGLVLPFLALHYNYRVALAVGGVLGATAAIVAARYYVDPPRKATSVRGLGDVVRGMMRLVRSPRTILFTLACMVLVSGQTIMNAFFAITAIADVHVSAALAAGAFAFAQICAVAGRVVWGKLSDTLFRGDRALPIATIGAILTACAWTIAHIAPGAVVELFIVGGLLGFSASSWNGVMATAMAEIGGPEYAGSVLGVALTFIFAAAGAAPLIFGSLADAHTLPLAWTVLAAVAAVGILPALGAAVLARRERTLAG
jgi:ACS family hexuronate transporter-like MFS transporter